MCACVRACVGACVRACAKEGEVLEIVIDTRPTRVEQDRG